MNTPLLPRQAWTVVAMLVAASVISYLDLQVLAVLVAPIKADLGIDDGRIGLLYGVFAVFYAFAGVPVARLSDRYSRKRLITAGMCLWSVMTLLAGLSRTFEHLLLARIGMGHWHGRADAGGDLADRGLLRPGAHGARRQYFPDGIGRRDPASLS